MGKTEPRKGVRMELERESVRKLFLELVRDRNLLVKTNNKGQSVKDLIAWARKFKGEIRQARGCFGMR